MEADCNGYALIALNAPINENDVPSNSYSFNVIYSLYKFKYIIIISYKNYSPYT